MDRIIKVKNLNTIVVEDKEFFTRGHLDLVLSYILSEFGNCKIELDVFQDDDFKSDSNLSKAIFEYRRVKEKLKYTRFKECENVYNKINFTKDETKVREHLQKSNIPLHIINRFFNYFKELDLIY